MYKVSIKDQEIGYFKEKNDINRYIEEIKIEKNNNIAFIEFKEQPTIELELVSRKNKISEEDIKNNIEKNITVEYSTYAITYKGKNIEYVSSIENAEKVVEKLKEKYDIKTIDQIGILQVYSDNYNDIKAKSSKKVVKKLKKVVNTDKKKESVKVAKTKTSFKVSTTPKISGVKFKVKPLSGIITSRFGGRKSPGGIGSTNHKGLDIAAKMGTTIRAAASGTVKFAGYKGSLGNLIIINNGNGVETYYAHCSKLYVSKGQKVKAGDKIAAVGKTGAATGPHLHFEIHVNGTAINPQKYLY